MNYPLLFTLIAVWLVGMAFGMVWTELKWQRNLTDGPLLAANKRRKAKKTSVSYLRLVGPQEAPSKDKLSGPPTDSAS